MFPSAIKSWGWLKVGDYADGDLRCVRITVSDYTCEYVQLVRYYVCITHAFSSTQEYGYVF